MIMIGAKLALWAVPVHVVAEIGQSHGALLSQAAARRTRRWATPVVEGIDGREHRIEVLRHVVAGVAAPACRVRARTLLAGADCSGRLVGVLVSQRDS